MSSNRRKQQAKLDKSAAEPLGRRDEKAGSQVLTLAVLIIIVAIAVTAAHWPMLSAKSFSFDDVQYLGENLLVQNPSWASAWRFLTEVLEPSTVRGYYQPLAMISIMLDYAMGGRDDNLGPFHRTSLVVHVANTALIIVLLYLLFGQVWVAAMVGLLFGVHPMTVEPSVWVSDRKTLLAMFFVLWCLILYVRFARRRDWRFYGGCLLMYVLSLMSKPTGTPLPVLLLLLDYWPIRRLSKRVVLEKVPFFVVGGVSAIITFISQKGAGGVTMPAEYGFGRIPLTFCHNIIFYPYKMLWPVNLSSHYAFPDVLRLSDPMVLAGVIGTCILIPLLVISLRWTRAPLTGWLIFFVAILPTMQVVKFSNVIASDKFAYLPSVGLLMILAWFLTHLWGSARPGHVGIRQIGLIVMVLVLAVSETVATRRYLVHWQDTESLWRHMIAIAPREHSLHRGLGYTLLRQGRVDEAIEEYHKALRLKSNNSIAHHGLAVALAQNNQIDQAIFHFNRAIMLRPNYAKAHSDLAVALLRKGDVKSALEHLRESIRLRPNLWVAVNNLAWVLATHENPQARNPAEAVELAERACKITHYERPETLDTLAAAYAAAGRFDEAVKIAEKAVELAVLSEDTITRPDDIRRRLRLYRERKPYHELAQPL